MYIAQPTNFTGFAPISLIPDAPYKLAQKLRLTGFIPHEGIAFRLKWNYETWQWEVTIAHFSKTGQGVLLSTLDEFRNGNEVFVIDSPSSPEHAAIIIENINEALRSQAINGPLQYDADRRNCQHFTSWAYGNEPKNDSATAAKAILGLSALVFILRNLGD
jgi:hypothetical protein